MTDFIKDALIFVVYFVGFALLFITAWIGMGWLQWIQGDRFPDVD